MYLKSDSELLLTTACPVECEFCVYSCKKNGEWMSTDTIRKVVEEYYKNNFKYIRIGGGEPFYNLKKLDECINILCEYYKSRNISIITSGFWAKNEQVTKKVLYFITKKELGNIILSADRFHLKKIPFFNIINFLKNSKELDIPIILRLDIDSESYSFIDSIIPPILEYKPKISIHSWGPLGRGEKLNPPSEKEFEEAKTYLYLKIRELAKKYNYFYDINKYIIKSAIRNKCHGLFPVTFPNGDVYICTLALNSGFIGNINKKNLKSLISEWRKSSVGQIILKGDCFSPQRFDKICKFCKTLPLPSKNGTPKRFSGNSFIKIFSNTNFNNLIKKLSKENKEHILSFQFNEDDLNQKRKYKIKKFINNLRQKNIQFLLSRPLPRCFESVFDREPKDCYNCLELFTIKRNYVFLCPNNYNIKGPPFKKTKNREEIYNYFKSIYKKLALNEKCKLCLYFIRKQCDGLCFRKPNQLDKKFEKLQKDLFNENIPFKGNISTINIEKVVNYLINLQTKNGYFYSITPRISNTYFFAGILKSLNNKPSKNTIKFIKCLQTGVRGFGEMPGEMPWTEWTVYALRILNWFCEKPKKIQKMANFYRTLQNEDGGFSSPENSQSNLFDTFNIIEILNLLGYRPINVKMAINWLKCNFMPNNLYVIYSYIKTLKQLNYKFDLDEIENLKDHTISLMKIDQDSYNLENLFYFLEILRMLKFNVKKYKKYMKNVQRIIKSIEYVLESSNLFFILKIFKLFNKNPKIKDLILKYVKKYELKEGGYYLPSEIYIFKNNAAFHTLHILRQTYKINMKKFILWLNSVANENGWGSLPRRPSDRDLYTTSSLLSYYFTKSDLNNNLKNKIIDKLESKLSNILKFKEDSSYIISRFSKEFLESMILLKEIVERKKIEHLIENILCYRNKYGGFGKPNISSVYVTYLAVYAIYLAEKYLNQIYGIKKVYIKKIKAKTVKWLKSCQNEDGGFGSAPNEFSNIQATFYTLYTLYLLNEKCRHPHKTIKWLTSLQKEDGGFAQYKRLSSDILMTFYSVGSALILEYMKNSGKNDV